MRHSKQAAREFLKSGERLRNNDAYQYDAVNVVRQVLANRGLKAYDQMVGAYRAKDVLGFNHASQRFLSLMRAEDSLMRTRREFLLGTLACCGQGHGTYRGRKKLCERNGRTQITYWGTDSSTAAARDYAFKEWPGLLQDFYVALAVACRRSRRSPQGTPGRDIDYFHFEKQWTEEQNDFPVDPSGDPINAA